MTTNEELIAQIKRLYKIKPWNGKQIKNPGVYEGIPIDDYHRGDICVEPSISSSGLRDIFNKSCAHYWDWSPYNSDRQEKEITAAMLLGGAGHHLLFGEEHFWKRYVMRPDKVPWGPRAGDAWHGNIVACKDWIKQQNEKKLRAITPDQWDAIKRICKSLSRKTLVQNGIMNGLIEISFFWKDAETGVWLKWRPDAVPNDSLDFCDMKITNSVFFDDLQRTIREHGYYQQAGMGADACRNLLGMDLQHFTLIFCESKRPHCVEIVTLKDNEIGRGIRANRAALRKFADCMKSGNWPGPGEEHADARWIEMRSFDQDRIDEQLKHEGV